MEKKYVVSYRKLGWKKKKKTNRAAEKKILSQVGLSQQQRSKYCNMNGRHCIRNPWSWNLQSHAHIGKINGRICL